MTPNLSHPLTGHLLNDQPNNIEKTNSASDNFQGLIAITYSTAGNVWVSSPLLALSLVFVGLDYASLVESWGLLSLWKIFRILFQFSFKI